MNEAFRIADVARLNLLATHQYARLPTRGILLSYEECHIEFGDFVDAEVTNCDYRKIRLA